MLKGKGRGHHSGPSCLERQIQTPRQEMRDANTGLFSNKTICIRMAPYEQFAKIYRTVRIQNSAGNQQGIAMLADRSPLTEFIYPVVNLVESLF